MLSLFWATILVNKRNIKIAVLIFVLSIVSGYIINPNNELIVSSFAKLNELANDIINNKSVLYSISTIFLNNLKVALFMILLGTIFGVYPIIMLSFNGIFIGIFIKMFVENGQPVTLLFLGLLPHGLFELAAIILAAAYGMKLGFAVFRTLINFIKGIEIIDYKIKFSNMIKQTMISLIGISIILLIAAIIESTLSLFLIKNFN